MVLRVGLTGGIACGKSRVLKRFAAAGFHTIDLDRVAHEVMAPGGPAYADVVSTFGESILAADETIDRRRLGELVFADPDARGRLNSLVHPRVRQAEAERVAEIVADPSAVFVTDAALLVESGIHLRFDRLVVVHCSPDEQLRRLMARDRIDEAAARARIDAQMFIDDKRSFAHLTVDASGSLEDTDRRADELVEPLRRLAASPRQPIVVGQDRVADVQARVGERGPRGLTARAVANRIAEDGGMEMESLARLLDPPTRSPWYLAADNTAAVGSIDGILVPVVVWSLARLGPDALFLSGAAESLSRLVARDRRSAHQAGLAARAIAAEMGAAP